ncbi:MAG: amidohydrolase [Bryobacterales bacterium]|nr:amidohydrolase [Bryobacterales bacterium]
MRALAVAACLWWVPAGAAEVIVIRNARVLPVTRPAFQGAVLVRDGRIAGMGEKVAAPPGATVIDAAGQYLMPGIIDAHLHIAAESINEGSISVSSMVRIEDVVNPEDISIYRALAGGVTTVNVLHGSANSVGGTCAIIKTRWGKDAEGLLFSGAKPGLKFALGENPKRAGASPGRGTAPRYPATRMGVEDVIRQAFTEARQYREAWRAYETKKARNETAVPPRRDLKLEPLVEVLEGRRRAHVHAYRADEILMALRLAEEFGFKIATLDHGLEGYKVAREIARNGAGVTTFSDWWSYKVEAYDAIPYNAALLHRKGVLVSLNSDDVSAELTARLNTEAAKTIRYGGLSEDEALALITINPARQLEIDRRVGSIEPGKDADLTLFDKHPLSAYARVQKVLIDGQVYFDRDRAASEQAERERRKKALLEKMEKEKAGPVKPAPARRPQ